MAGAAAERPPGRRCSTTWSCSPQAARCPKEKQPLDAAFFDLPERLLDEGPGRCWTRSSRPATGWPPRSIAWWCWASAARTWAPGRCSRPAAIPITTSCRGRPAAAGRGSTSRATTSITTRVARAAGPAGRRRPLGDHRHQQERRHAGDGRRLPHLPRRPAEVVRRRRGEAAAADRARHRRDGPPPRPGRGPGLPGGLSHLRRRGRTVLGAQPRRPAARRGDGAGRGRSCSKARRP